MHTVQMWQGKVVWGNRVWPSFCPLRQKGRIVFPDWVESNEPTRCSLNKLQGQWGVLSLCEVCVDVVFQIGVWSFSALRWPLQMPGCWSTSFNQSCNWEMFSLNNVAQAVAELRVLVQKKIVQVVCFLYFIRKPQKKIIQKVWERMNYKYTVLPARVSHSLTLRHCPPALHGPSQMKITDIIYWRLRLPAAPVQFPCSVRKLTHITFSCFSISYPSPRWLTEVTRVAAWRYAGYLMRRTNSHSLQRQYCLCSLSFSGASSCIIVSVWLSMCVCFFSHEWHICGSPTVCLEAEEMRKFKIEAERCIFSFSPAHTHAHTNCKTYWRGWVSL